MLSLLLFTLQTVTGNVMVLPRMTEQQFCSSSQKNADLTNALSEKPHDDVVSLQRIDVDCHLRKITYQKKVNSSANKQQVSQWSRDESVRWHHEFCGNSDFRNMYNAGWQFVDSVNTRKSKQLTIEADCKR